MKKVAVVMGSKSDWPVVKKAQEQLNELGIDNDVFVYSAHRTPAETMEFAKNSQENGYGVIIAAAGMAAHLAGVIAAWTTLPVIALPLSSKNLDGIDALLATVQMPPGIPVAVVGIDTPVNAALLAAEILAISDPSISEKLKQKRDSDKEKVLNITLD